MIVDPDPDPDPDKDPEKDPVPGGPSAELESLMSPQLLDDPSPDPTLMRNSVRQRLFGGPPRVFQIDRFVVLGRIGAGSMGVVFEAYDPKLERKLALKVLHPHADRQDPASRERMLREARSLAKLSHPNVVPVFEVGEHDSDVFIAMELVRGQTLYDHARSEGRSPAQIVEVYVQAARGLAAAHQQGLVHRDFKPTNALIGEDGRVRVLDFGLARPQTASTTPAEPHGRTTGPAASPLTQTGALVGTPAYMAPEQSAGAPATPASDQYSLCASLFEALTATLPTDYERDEQRLDALASCPRALRPILIRGLAPDPERRWPSMQALSSALERASHRGRPGGLALGLAGAGALAIMALWWTPDSPCASPEVAWEPQQRDQAELALRQANAELAPLAITALERYAGTWSEVQAETCVAHHEQHAISGQLFDRAMLCLERRRSALSSLVEGLSAIDERSAPLVIDAIDALPGLARCRDHDLLIAELPPPEDPAVAAATIEIQADLDRALALGRLGDLDASVELARDGARRADALAYRPIQARAALAVGTTQRTQGKLDDAVAELDRALWLAEAGGDDELTARCSAELTLAFASQGKSDATQSQARRTEAAIEHLARLSLADVALSQALAALAYTEGRLQEAREHGAQALEHAQELPDAPASVIGEQLDRLASIDVALGQHERANEMLARALAFKEASLGPLHPTVLTTRFQIATAEIAQGHLEPAIEDLLAVLDDARASLGDASALAGMIHGNLNIAYTRAGREAEAIEHAERSVEILRDAFGRENPKLLSPLMNLGGTYVQYRRFPQARASFEESIALGRSTIGGGVDLASVLLNLANLDAHEGDPAAALRYASEAVPMLEQALGQPVHHELSRAHAVVADAQHRLGDLAAAEAAARQSIGSAPQASASRMLALFILARIVADRGREADAEGHAREAIALAEQLGAASKAEEYREWLATRPGAQSAGSP